jgi:hypothetical protein
VNVADALLMFLATFVGVILAFALDGWRQHATHVKWLESYVGGMVRRLGASFDGQQQLLVMLASRTSAFDHWLGATAESDLSDDDWHLLGNPALILVLDLSALLRSEILTDIPAELVETLQELDDRFQMGAATSNEALTAHRIFTAPLVHDRVVPLSPQQANVVRDAQESAAIVYAAAEELLAVLDRFLAVARDYLSPSHAQRRRWNRSVHSDRSGSLV